ncbi:hypothetical protein Tco_0728682 [Tanacetum coccineum]|uniref:Reverse transcriptase domain-containing protein n=1 Tax=Tanacetum coccineum TaxID=301880 RepID=A0ABQ4YMX4_9ASTR
MIDQGVTAALTARDANRNGDDSHTSGTGARRTERVTRECTYQDFMKCQPLYFKGTEGVVELTQWFERMETVFRISNCSVENQIKFSTCYKPTFPETSTVCGVECFLRESDKFVRMCVVLLDMITSTTTSQEQNVSKSTAAVTGERKEYAGNLPLCNKCKFHHNGPCTGTTREDCPKLKNRNHGNQAEGLEHMEWSLPVRGRRNRFKTLTNIEDEIEA